jgi:tetratricopeptide (TPR) repeat protein
MKKHTQSPSLLYHHGRALEGQKCYTEAAVQYAEILKMDPLHIDAGNRLMIVYRKLKAYRKELAVITKAIEAHRKHIESSQRAWIKSHQKIADLTRSLAQTLGLLDSKGLPLYENELLEKWQRRRDVVLNKLKKKK